MYVEISPRQSGKTTRLVNEVVRYLLNGGSNVNHIALTSHNSNSTIDLKNKIRDVLSLDCSRQIGLEWPDELTYKMVDSLYMSKIITPNTNMGFFGGYNREPDFWFFDEFAWLPPNKLLHPITGGVIENGYYCTTPTDRTNVIDIVVNHCRDNNVTINFNNPWTEARLQEQSGFSEYTRQTVLTPWVEYMTEKGFPINGLKENWLPKYVKRHRFSGNKKF